MRLPAVASLLLALLPALPMVSIAFEALDDGELETVSGAGIALALEDFEFAMAPTSYFEQVGSAPAGGGCSGTGSVASNINCWRRGDLRWYGINISGATNTGYHWNDTTSCNAGSLDCPRGGVIPNFSPFDNPYVIRSWSPVGIAANGACVNGVTGSCTTPAAIVNKTIYEFLAPTSQPNYTFSCWGEMETGSTRNSQTEALGTNAGNVLKSQNIIRGNAAGSAFRIFDIGTAGNPTFAMLYHSYLRGDYRFSVAQNSTGSTDVIGQAPVFGNTEGMYFRNVNAYIPIGQLYYQALTIRSIGTAGNFELSLTPLPAGATTSDFPVQNKHYGLRTGAFTGVATGIAYNENGHGYEIARAHNNGDIAADTSGIYADYLLTHGYSYWGSVNWRDTGTPTAAGRNVANTADDGILFRSCIGCVDFYAYAYRPLVIDKRGPTGSTQESQNYQCSTGNTGSCTIPSGTNGSSNIVYGNVANASRSYPVIAGGAVNLGDSRIEGLMIQMLRIQSCGGVPAC